MRQAKGVSIVGHSEARLNGWYAELPAPHERDGTLAYSYERPVLRNSAGMYCYLYESRVTHEAMWLLNDTFTPDSTACVAKPRQRWVAPGGRTWWEAPGGWPPLGWPLGPLPVGAHVWLIADGNGGWIESVLTLTLYKRPLLEVRGGQEEQALTGKLSPASSHLQALTAGSARTGVED